MKIKTIVSALSLFIGLAILSTPSFAAGTRVAFINAQELMLKAPQAKVARNELKKEFGVQEKALAAQGAAIQKKEKKRQHDLAFMSTAQRKEAENHLRGEITRFNHDMAAFRNAFAVKRNALLKKLEKRIYGVIVRVAKRNGYDIVLSNGVIYAAKKVNITPQVLSALRKSGK